MALDGGGSPEHLTARRLMNAAYTLHLDSLRAATAWDPSVYEELVEEFDAALDAPFPRPLPLAPVELPAMNDADAALRDRIAERAAAVAAMGGEVQFG